MLRSVLLTAAVASAEVHFKETFDSTWEDRWVSAGDGKFVHSAGDFYGDAEADKGLQTSQDARFYHSSTKFGKEFSNKGKSLALGFSVKHGQKIDCGGGYLKYLPAGYDGASFNGDTEYNIMFGPDICGHTKKVHVILNYKGKNVEIKKNIPCETDQLTHYYTLLLNSDNTYEVHVDGNKKESGKLEEDFDFLAPKEIKDPEVSKPADWVDQPMMDDPEDKKPEGYDDIPKMINDPEAEKPDDWDDEDDGEWEPPQIANPDYKGPWSPKRIDNPDYKGAWVHPMIPNPEYAEDPNIYSFDSFGGLGIDIWQVKSGSVFDNIIVADSLDEVEEFRKANDNTAAEKAMFEKQEKEKADAAAAAAKSEEDEEDDDDDDSAKQEL
jgi:calreticulin